MPQPHAAQPEPTTAVARQAVLRGVERVRRHWRLVGGVLAVTLLVAAAYSWAAHQQRRAEARTWRAIAQALEADAPAVALDRVVERDDLQAARSLAYAELYRMRAHFDAGAVEQARAAAEAFLNRWPGHRLAPQVRSDYARLLEADGHWTRAREAYQDVLGSGVAYLQPEAMLGQARCLEQEDKPDEARAAYLSIQSRGREEQWPRRVLQSAQLRLLALRAPEAQAPPAPPVGAGPAPASPERTAVPDEPPARPPQTTE